MSIYIPIFHPEPDPVDGLISRASMAKYILRLKAEEYSQDYFLISWEDDLDFKLWDDCHGSIQEGAFGETRMSESERALFRDLATVADGWWRDIHSDDGFVPMAEWVAITEARSSP
jgi:hypothetical protein